jgi:NIPSNAP
MTFQIREYAVKPGEMEEFVKEWRTQVVPLRIKSGFKVLGAWTVSGTDQFVWIVSYDGPKSWEEAEADYYGSPERKALHPDPGRHLSETSARLMNPV